MVVRRGKKSRYMRGSRTHGWGRVAQHRRSGRKGGRGNVGHCKHRWSWVVSYAPNWYGKHGFTRHPSLVTSWRLINVGQLDEIIDELVKKKLAEYSNGGIKVDLTLMGFNKLGGGGRVTKPIIVHVYSATKKAKQKIEEAGGKVILLSGE